LQGKEKLVLRLQTPLKLSLEQAIDFIAKDELVEITPENIRLRKKLLTYAERLRDIALNRRDAEKED
jgi:GTP-binding protein